MYSLLHITIITCIPIPFSSICYQPPKTPFFSQPHRIPFLCTTHTPYLSIQSLYLGTHNIHVRMIYNMSYVHIRSHDNNIYVCLEWVSERVVMYSELGTYSGGCQRTPPRIDYSERTHRALSQSWRQQSYNVHVHIYTMWWPRFNCQFYIFCFFSFVYRSFRLMLLHRILERISGSSFPTLQVVVKLLLTIIESINRILSNLSKLNSLGIYIFKNFFKNLRKQYG